MKKLKLFLVGAISLLATSCLVEDEDSSTAQGLYDSPNIVNFTDYNINLILTPSSGVQEYSTRVNYITDLPTNGGEAASFRYEVNTAETTISASDYEIETSSDYIFNIPAGEEVSEGWFDYKIIPDNIPVGQVNYLVIDLIKITGASNIVGGKLIVTIDKCDPPLAGDYTVANGNFGGDGETVTISALNCSGDYQASNLAPFTGVYFWNFNHDSSDDSIVISGNLANFSNTVYGNGQVNPDGSISFSGVGVSDTGLQDYSFDLIPN